MITVKNAQLDDNTIAEVNKLIDMDINAKVAFKLMRIIKEMSSLIECKVRLERKIFDKYTEKDENGMQIPVLDDDNIIVENAVRITDVESFNIEMSELMNIENIIAYDKINFDDMNLNTSIKIKDLIKIDFLFS